MKAFDVIVLGLGGVGAAACYHAALRKGRRVLGLERFGVAHDRGSSHGETRIFRRSYDHAGYAPLLDRSLDGWQALERRAGHSLFRRTGLVLVSDAAGMNYEPDAGYVLVEPSVRAHCDLAREAGAELHFEEPALAWHATEEDGVCVTTSKGRYVGDALVIAGGAWSSELLAALGLPLVVERIPQAWFASSPLWEADAPCFIFDIDRGYFFGVPGPAPGRIKVAGRTKRTTVHDPALLDPALSGDELEAIGDFIDEHLHGVSRRPLAQSACMCTMTPDSHFIVDAHPEFPRVVFAAGLSGHGYKFVPVLGEALADLAVDGATPLPIDFLRMREKPC